MYLCFQSVDVCKKLVSCTDKKIDHFLGGRQLTSVIFVTRHFFPSTGDQVERCPRLPFVGCRRPELVDHGSDGPFGALVAEAAVGSVVLLDDPWGDAVGQEEQRELEPLSMLQM